MPLFFHPSVLQLVLKAEGIRSNPNFSLLTTLADIPRLVKSGQLGEEEGRNGGGEWQAEVGDCLSELVIPLRGSHQASGDVPRPGPCPS